MEHFLFFPVPRITQPKIRFLGQKVCSVARGHTHRHTDRYTKVNTEDTLSGFQEFFLQHIIKDQSYNNLNKLPWTQIFQTISVILLARHRNIGDEVSTVLYEEKTQKHFQRCLYVVPALDLGYIACSGWQVPFFSFNVCTYYLELGWGAASKSKC